MLYEKVLEVDERVLLATDFQIEGLEVRTGTSGEKIQVSKAPGEFTTTRKGDMN